MEILHNDILQERSWVVYNLIPRVGGLCSKAKTEIHKYISSTFEDNDLSANAYFYYKIREVQCIAPLFAWKFTCDVFFDICETIQLKPICVTKYHIYIYLNKHDLFPKHCNVTEVYRK